MTFKAVDARLFFSKQDSQDQRLGDWAGAGTRTAEANWFVAGYADDEGIQRNGGRIGAAQAPDAIRTQLYKMTPASKQPFTIADLGNLVGEGDLAARHVAAENMAKQALQKGGRLLTLGGGHDYAYPDSAAFVHYCEQHGQRPLIVNIDAHLDVRPMDKGIHSGTPFYRLLTNHAEVDFAEIGIQRQCASVHHVEWAKEKNARVLFWHEITASEKSLVQTVQTFLADWQQQARPLFLSIDIDSFASAYAMGCSQSFATGFVPNDFMPLLDYFCHHFDLRQLGIYEVSPPLDLDQRTARLAAQLAYQVMMACQEKK